MNRKFQNWLLAAVWMFLPLYGAACDCPSAGAPCKAFAITPTVFAGRVTRISTINRKTPSGVEFKDRLISFEVERSYRGWEAKTAQVVTGWGGGDCGYDFQEGVRYLVYAYSHQETGKLYTGICQRTRPVGEASEDLEYLNKKDDSAHGVGIEGRIEELDAKSRTGVVGFVADIPVLVEGPSGRQRVVSGEDGGFRLWGLLPGRYRVTPVLPDYFLPDTQTVKVEKNSCAELRFLATPRPDHDSADLRKENRWHPIFHGRLANVEVDGTLYERRKDEDIFIQVRITNVTDRPVAVDLRKFWDVIYPNSWGFSETSTSVVDEERIIRTPMSGADEKRLTFDYSANRLTTIGPHRSLTYIRGFTVGHNIRKEVESAGHRYLIVGLDGVLRLTNGQTTEEVIFPLNATSTETSRWVVIQLPVNWQVIPQNSLVVEERP